MFPLPATLLFLALTIGLLRVQLLDWPNRIRWGFRFLLAAICAWLAMAFGGVFAHLPDGWFDALTAHVFTIPGIFVACMLLSFSTASFAMGILSTKVARTL